MLLPLWHLIGNVEKASRCQYWLTWLTRLIHWGREREVVWPLSSLNAVVSYVFLCVLICCLYRFLDVSCLFFWELYSRDARVSTCWHHRARHSTPHLPWHKRPTLPQISPTPAKSGIPLEGFSWIPSLAGQNIGGTMKWQQGCLQKSERFTEVRNVNDVNI